jgi:hypothetical protein
MELGGGFPFLSIGAERAKSRTGAVTGPTFPSPLHMGPTLWGAARPAHVKTILAKSFYGRLACFGGQGRDAGY